MNTVVLSVFVALCSVMLVAGKAFNPSAWNLSFKDEDFKKASMPIAAPVWFLKTDKQKKLMPASMWFHDTDDDFRKRAETYWHEQQQRNNVPEDNSWHRNKRDVMQQMVKLWREHLEKQNNEN
jgi:hypothetical protein